MSSLLKIDKMFNSILKRSKIAIFNEFAMQIENKKLTAEELEEIINNLFESPAKSKKPQSIPNKLTAYKIFLDNYPDMQKSELKLIWKNKTSSEKQVWKNKIDNPSTKKQLVYNNKSYLIDNDNIVYNIDNDNTEIGYYDNNIIDFY
jgi:hypothetical protein